MAEPAAPAVPPSSPSNQNGSSSSSAGLFAGLTVNKTPSTDAAELGHGDEAGIASSSKKDIFTRTKEPVELHDNDNHPPVEAVSTSSSGDVVVVHSAPVTDKLLALFGGSETQPTAAATASSRTPENDTEATAAPTPTTTPATVTHKTEAAASSKAPPTTTTSSPSTPTLTLEQKMAAAASKTATPIAEDEAFQVVTHADAVAPPSSMGATTTTSPAFKAPPTTTSTSNITNLVIPSKAPIPNADAMLRLLRKFLNKTRPSLPVAYGGTQKSAWSSLFSSSSVMRSDDPRIQPYLQLVDLLVEEEATATTTEETASVERVLGKDGDDATKARQSLTCFLQLLHVWCHASASTPTKSSSDQLQTLLLSQLPHAMEAANALVAHGCLDQVPLQPQQDDSSSTQEQQQQYWAIHVVCESIFVASLEREATELAALKLLLTSGCRSTPDGEALVRGSHLLQTIRVMYHVYLTTELAPNKTTARAALQQLTTSVVKRMLVTEVPDQSQLSPAASEEHSFPSENHRDAFLVLRSLCKLSLKSFPETGSVTTSTTPNGTNLWEGGASEPPSGVEPTQDAAAPPSTPNGKQPAPEPTLVRSPLPADNNKAVHPALESKILALELLLYVLQNTDMSGDFLKTQSGPQFQYAIRNYLCVSLLKNCTSDNTTVVSLSLRLFVPLIRNFRSHLKTEIEAFVTNVFFVILDSKNSTVEHKIRVVNTFDEICSDPTTLAEIFLNYDCDLSAVDLFHRIVHTLSRVAKTEDATKVSSTPLLAGSTAATRMEKLRSEQRELRLDAMKALRQVLASLHASIVTDNPESSLASPVAAAAASPSNVDPAESPVKEEQPPQEGKQTLVQIYDSKKKRRQEESEAILRFNQKPSAGISYAAKCGHIDGTDPVDVARYLLKNKEVFDKTQIGEYLGREADYQGGFALRVLHAYVNTLNFSKLAFDEAIRYYLSNFRLPGEAQKIDRIMEKFAERYTNQNPSVFPSADVAFILAFSIIMLNTDLHNPAIKEERRMTKEGFIRNNRGICDGKDLPAEFLNSIFDRIKKDPISLKEDDDARERSGVGKSKDGMASGSSSLSSAVFFSSHYEEIDRTRETNYQKERDQIVRTTESLLRRKRHSTTAASHEHGKTPARHRSHRKHHSSVKFVRTVDTGLRDEYVSPMFEVTWAPTLAAFSTAMESANGTVGALLAIASDEELEQAAENAAETIEVCLTGFRLAICTAGLCGNDTARDAFMLALARFSQLGTGARLEPRHIRCTQTLLSLARSDGELLGNTWEHVFKALSEVNRFHQVFQLMARNDRVAAAAAERRRKRLEAKEKKKQERERRRRAAEAGESSVDSETGCEDDWSTSSSSSTESERFSDDDDYLFDDEMDSRAIDEANARFIYDAVSESLIDSIYQRSASLSQPAIKEFVYQLCRVSRMEISGYGGHVGSMANTIDLTQVHYRQQHTLLNANGPGSSDQAHHNQPNIYNLQKLVEVAHYNMDSRPRLIFAELWTTVSGHLTSTALHSNAAVAMYAVDSFRQLSIQYLQREELGIFDFQRKFMKPFETVMARSEHSTTKELLLKCVERIIYMFGSTSSANSSDSSSDAHAGTLRSGWRPVLAVLGLAGHDKDEGIAKMGFEMLTGQLRQCLSVEKDANGVDKPRAGFLLVERFVDLVDALLMYVSGPHEDMSIVSIDHLVTLSSFLADDSVALPLVRKRSASASTPEAVAAGSSDSAQSPNRSEELELWWPILLGLSRSVGDDRKKVRLKSLVTLLGIINQHFIPDVEDKESASSAESHSAGSPKHGDLQTLQLIFRGVLNPVLEHAENDAHIGPNPSLPDDFKRFITKPPAPLDKNRRNLSWIETTFEHFMDGCVSVCMRSLKVFKEDALVEEIFAMLNSCLLSDSGILAVRGLRRLEQFVTDDLEKAFVTDDTWATVSHMLSRCVTVRGLPRTELSTATQNGSHSSLSSVEGAAGKASTEDVHDELEAQEAVNEFVMEERLIQSRRYIGGNATKVIGSLLTNENYSSSIGMRWRLFLTAGLGQGIKDWEKAASILDAQLSSDDGFKANVIGPPHYLENAAYARKLMNKLLMRLIAKKEVVVPSESNAAIGARSGAAHALIEDQTQSLVSAFLSQEAVLADGESPPWGKPYMELLTTLVKELLASYDRLEDKVLFEMPWLCPILSTCIQSHDESIRLTVHELVQRVFKGTMVDKKISEAS